MSSPSRGRLDRWLPAIVLAAGTLLFLAGGSRHPHINANSGMAPAGSDEYFRQFAQLIVARPNWPAFHTLILMGPVLWALAVAGAARALPLRVRALGDVARYALVMGATLWALEFVMDGQTGVQLAAAIVAAGPGADATPLALFSANAFTMSRLGLVSIDLFAVSVLCLGLATLGEWRTRRWAAAVGLLGVPLGIWPLIASLRGEFWPGPFTNIYWTPFAILLGLWFLLFATTLPSAAEPRALP